MSVSLCVVARNEAAFLAACLDSARPVVDEMIVVDTGSTDATPEIARRAGARVIRAPWPGDLGRAHDLPVAHARGDWVLSLDGDEVLDPSVRQRLARLVRAPDVEGYRLPVRNYTYYPPGKLRPVDTSELLTLGALAYIPTCPVRLFRRRRHHRFRGQLHQSVGPSIVARGGRIRTSDVVIHHYGFLRFDRVKTSLYRILARRQTALTPEDARAWIDLGLTFSTRRELPGSLAAFRRAHGLGHRAEASFLIGRTLAEMDHPAAAVPFLRKAIRLNPTDRAADFDRVDAWELLGHTLESLGRRQEAEAAYGSALRLRPASPGALNNLAGLLMERGRLASAERLVDRLVGAFPGLSTAWATLGALRLRQGRLAVARRACEVALDIAPLNRPALVNLALVLERTGRPRRARLARRAAAELVFGDSSFPGGDVQASASRRPSRRAAPGGVISVISYLHGGSGRVLVDAVAALRGRRHLVLCLEPGDSSGQRLQGELRRLGAEVATLASDLDVERAIREARPEIVLHHWSGGPPIRRPVRSGHERWIAIGHAPLPMPGGYDRYVVLSEFHQQFQTHLPRARVHRIPNAVDLRLHPARARRSRGPVTIAMLTRLDPGKFPRHLLAFLPPLARLGARLVIAGRGARRWELEPEIARRGIPVRFLGPISSAQVPAFLARADIGLHLTEVHQETCSMTILEMLAAGLPIVAEPKGCLPEMVASHDNGFLATDPREIAARLEELIRSPALRRRQGERSRRRARAYSMSRYRLAMRALVEAACAGPPAPVPVWSPARDPETVSLRGWRPSLTYLVCAPSAEVGARLGTALQATGVAGIPEACFARWRGALRGRERATSLGRLMEDGATPNGVFGAVLLPGDLAALGRARQSFPNLRYVCIDADARRSHGHPGRPVIRVGADEVRRDPARVARSLLEWLGIRPSGTLLAEDRAT